MRKLFIIILIVITVAIAAIAIYFVATTPKTSAGVRFPLSPAHRALIASVPVEAESFALIPTAAALEAKLRANRITSAPLDDWASRQTLPAPWMVGGADLVVWREGKQTRYLVRLDPVRAVLVRAYLAFRGDSGNTLLVNTPPGGGLPPEEVARIAALAGTLPSGDALIVQREPSRSFPPIARPAVTSLKVNADDFVLTSHAASESPAPAAPLRASLPHDAMLTYAFSSPPRSLNDLNRLFGAKVAGLLDDGGEVIIYDIETRKLLPRPVGIIAFPATPTHRAALESFLRTVAPAEIAGVRSRTGEKGGLLLLSFDDSIARYLKDTTDVVSWDNARWGLRMDPRRMVPVLQELHDDIGLRIAAPHLYQSVRDLDRWVGALQEARIIEALDTVRGNVEELKVRVSS
jgi:hypothetical protein